MLRPGFAPRWGQATTNDENECTENGYKLSKSSLSKSLGLSASRSRSLSDKDWEEFQVRLVEAGCAQCVCQHVVIPKVPTIPSGLACWA